MVRVAGNLNKVISKVSSCQITYSIRDTEFEDVSIKKGDYIVHEQHGIGIYDIYVH